MSYETALLLLPAFAACLALLGLLVHLGGEVIARGTVVGGLLTAELAALGGTVGLLLGEAPQSRDCLLISLAFCTLGAVLVGAVRARVATSVEGALGAAFALTAGALVIAADQLPHGAQQLDALVVGELLGVRWPTVAWITLVYAGSAALLRAVPDGTSPRRARWDLAFYALFGVGIAIAVHVAGALVAISFLLIPSVVSGWFVERPSSRLALGWTLGAVSCFAAIPLAVLADLPVGATVAVGLGAVLVLGLVARILLPRGR